MHARACASLAVFGMPSRGSCPRPGDRCHVGVWRPSILRDCLIEPPKKTRSAYKFGGLPNKNAEAEDSHFVKFAAAKKTRFAVAVVAAAFAAVAACVAVVVLVVVVVAVDFVAFP